MSNKQQTGSRRAFALRRLVMAVGSVLALSVGMVATASAANLSMTPAFSPFAHLGEATTMTAEFTLEGTEYHGFVAPLETLTIHLPAGIGLSNAGFPSCEQTTLESRSPQGCPTGSEAGPIGEATLEVPFSNEERQEQAQVYPIVGSSETVYFYIEGMNPTVVEVVMVGHYENDNPPYTRKIRIESPQVYLIPGAPIVSVLGLKLELGTFLEESGTTLHNVTAPNTCPVGQFAWGAEATFYNEPSHPLASAETPCLPAGMRQPTTTTLKASNTTPLLNETVTYTATVAPVTAGGTAPTETVTFLDNKQPIPGCSAQPLTAGASSSTASCQVSYTAYDGHYVTATYGGSLEYLGSHSEGVQVSLSAGHEEEVLEERKEAALLKQQEEEAAAKSGTGTGSSPPTGSSTATTASTTSTSPTGTSPSSTSPVPTPAPAQPSCVVPKLKGKSLAQAKQLLKKGHCQLGKVTKPKGHAKRVVVVSQKPGASSKLPTGTKIAVKLS